jgi:hypothetical protein
MAEDQEFDVTVPVLSGDERFQDDAEDGVDDRQQHETFLAPNPGVSSESYPVGVLKPHTFDPEEGPPRRYDDERVSAANVGPTRWNRLNPICSRL